MIRIAILALALLTGGGAAWLAYAMLAGSEDPPVVEMAEPLPTGEILVAKAGIERGTELGPANLEWQAWPEPAIGEGMVLRRDQPDAMETYTGWVSRNPLLPGEPVRAERLVEGEGGLMSLMLTPGMRAVAVRVSAESGAGGFITPNDRVDIIHTAMRDADGNGADEPVTTTLIRNVRVLAVDQVSERDETGAARVAETATLELTPEQVELLTTARNSGGLALALRAVDDHGETELGDFAHLSPSGGRARAPSQPTTPSDEQTPPEQESPAPRRASTEIRIIGSGQVETVQIGQDDG